MPRDVVSGTAARYEEAYERIAGEPFEVYRARHGVAPGDDEEALARLREEHG